MFMSFLSLHKKNMNTKSPGRKFLHQTMKHITKLIVINKQSLSTGINKQINKTSLRCQKIFRYLQEIIHDKIHFSGEIRIMF